MLCVSCVAAVVIVANSDKWYEYVASVLQRLQTKVIKIVDVSYGGENGFNQAIELASEALGNVKFIQEKKLIGLLCVAYLAMKCKI